MRVFGVVLIVLGLLGLALGGFSFTRKEKVADLGPVDITRTERERIPVAPVAAGLVLLAGVALVIAGRQRSS